MKTTVLRGMAPSLCALLLLGAMGCGGGSTSSEAHAAAPKAAVAPAADEDEGEDGEAEANDEGDAPASEPVAEAAPTADAVGAESYATFCAACHGPEGKGDGPAGGALNPKPANFADVTFWTEARTDAHLAKVIKEGGPAVGLSPLMAPWGAVLDDGKIAAVIGHMKTFKGK